MNFHIYFFILLFSGLFAISIDSNGHRPAPGFDPTGEVSECAICLGASLCFQWTIVLHTFDTF